jgi:DNA excision repair protein ERCC-6
MLVHWLNELATWAPGFRRVLIHKSAERAGEASRKITKRLLINLDRWLGQLRADKVNEPIDEKDLAENDPDSFCGTGYVVLTTFESIRRSTDIWVSHKWSYVVMDEGQKVSDIYAMQATILCSYSLTLMQRTVERFEIPMLK